MDSFNSPKSHPIRKSSTPRIPKINGREKTIQKPERPPKLEAPPFSHLLYDLRTYLENQVPLAPEEAAYLKASQDWLANMPRVSQQAQDLLNNGQQAKAELLIYNFNKEKPKRRAGPPKKLGPSIGVIRRALITELVNIGLRHYHEDKNLIPRLAEQLLKI